MESERKSSSISLIGLACAFAAIVIGAIHIDDCPIEPRIPIFLIVFGATSILGSLLGAIQCLGDLNQKGAWCLAAIGSVVGLFSLGWLVYGSIITFRIYHNYTHTLMDEEGLENPNYCHQTVYMFTFVGLIFTYASILLGILIALCFGCCALTCLVCAKGAMEENNAV